MRPPLLSTHAPSSTMSSLPSITCNFDDLRERMASFTDRFDDFIARNRRRLLEEHNQFQQTVADIQGNILPPPPPTSSHPIPMGRLPCSLPLFFSPSNQEKKARIYTYTFSQPDQKPNASAKKTSRSLRTKHPATKTHSPKKLPKRLKCALLFRPSHPNATTISPTATASGVK